MNPLPCSSPIIPRDSPKGGDLILGYNFLYHFNHIIDWKNGLITYDCGGIKSSASNALATAVNGVSLIKDFGEDVAISSLHLFHGDMDLPHLSFHASLEEQWDEEEESEEVETLLKLVPPAYHQYLDVFSKVKAEKIPPHCACDHHVKSEGLLPPVGVIYSLSNQESENLLAYFSENTDSSYYALGAVLSQVNDSGKQPIAFDSRKLLPAELNYEIHDKEPLGIVWALKRWRAFLLSLSNSLEVLTDHSSLQYFMSSKVLTCGQACWAEFLSDFHFTITYCPGRLATLPDALSHWDNMNPEREVDFIRKNPQNFHQEITEDGFQESRFFSIKVEIFSDLVDKFQKEVWQDKDYKEIRKQLERGESVTDYSSEPQAKLLLIKDRVVIPSNEEIQLNILQKCHDSPLAGHPGQEKTLNLIKRDFYWAGRNQLIEDYVSSFQKCSRNKNTHNEKFGLLKPLQIPSGPWNSLSVDLITQFPLSNNCDLILVVVYRFSKMAIFIPTYGKSQPWN
ncbi:hypothetical protein O181_029045 [Austropuccinia psidii MF-1]|uniref:Reverse transcriptase RNase H-like domain-containing protein n=1 Tax=Austropuccinia psidii MF-1 TaxID=1389203 RepID=A0A9Q3CTT7_9BASI|nr:hypothetical protein [Austropuccinia psidii MF-1]